MMIYILWYLWFAAMITNMESVANKFNERDCIRFINRPSAIKFPVGFDHILKLYYTTVKLGNPPKEFRLLVDTGSSDIWVSCQGCSNCLSEDIRRIYKPQQSSSASLVSCADKRCPSSPCSDKCNYSILYGEGTVSKGSYYSDDIYIFKRMERDEVVNSSVRIVFGCSTYVFGLFATLELFDGILGLGYGTGLSLFDQMSSQGVTPKILSHCLDGMHGGTLAFGVVDEPDITYTKLNLAGYKYHINLKGIAVNSQDLDIDISLLTTSKSTGAYIDSGATSTMLPTKIFFSFINAVASSVRASQAEHFISNSQHCYIINESIYDVFPPVTLKFTDGAYMELDPSNYLQRSAPFTDDNSTWCISWVGSQRVEQNHEPQKFIIFGYIVLRDKIVIYDLIHERLGWKKYNCTLPYKVISPISDHKINTLAKYLRISVAVCFIIVVVLVILHIINKYR